MTSPAAECFYLGNNQRVASYRRPPHVAVQETPCAPFPTAARNPQPLPLPRCSFPSPQPRAGVPSSSSNVPVSGGRDATRRSRVGGSGSLFTESSFAAAAVDSPLTQRSTSVSHSSATPGSVSLSSFSHENESPSAIPIYSLSFDSPASQSTPHLPGLHESHSTHQLSFFAAGNPWIANGSMPPLEMPASVQPHPPEQAANRESQHRSHDFTLPPASSSLGLLTPNTMAPASSGFWSSPLSHQQPPQWPSAVPTAPFTSTSVLPPSTIDELAVSLLTVASQAHSLLSVLRQSCPAAIAQLESAHNHLGTTTLPAAVPQPYPSHLFTVSAPLDSHVPRLGAPQPANASTTLPNPAVPPYALQTAHNTEPGPIGSAFSFPAAYPIPTSPNAASLAVAPGSPSVRDFTGGSSYGPHRRPSLRLDRHLPSVASQSMASASFGGVDQPVHPAVYVDPLVLPQTVPLPEPLPAPLTAPLTVAYPALSSFPNSPSILPLDAPHCEALHAPIDLTEESDDCELSPELTPTQDVMHGGVSPGQSLAIGSQVPVSIEAARGVQNLYYCDECTYSSNRRANTEAHQRTHTGEKPFSCFLCGLQFTQSGTRNRHVRRMHGALAPGARWRPACPDYS